MELPLHVLEKTVINVVYPLEKSCINQTKSKIHYKSSNNDNEVGAGQSYFKFLSQAAFFLEGSYVLAF